MKQICSLLRWSDGCAELIELLSLLIFAFEKIHNSDVLKMERVLLKTFGLVYNYGGSFVSLLYLLRDARLTHNATLCSSLLPPPAC